jgi:hypothetical protein
VIVIDTSIAVKWVVDEPGHEDALALLAIAEKRRAPDLLLAELAYVLRRKTMHAEISAAQVGAALGAVVSAIDHFAPSSEIVADAIQLATQLNHSTYDCFFLAVALRGGVLATADQVFATKCAQSGFEEHVFALGAPIAELVLKLARLAQAAEAG